jgi:hypothetical protein
VPLFHQVVAVDGLAAAFNVPRGTRLGPDKHLPFGCADMARSSGQHHGCDASDDHGLVGGPPKFAQVLAPALRDCAVTGTPALTLLPLLVTGSTLCRPTGQSQPASTSRLQALACS